MKVVGIDPGLGGAFTITDPESKGYWVFDMPTYTTQKGKQKRRHVDGGTLADILTKHQPISMAYIEEVSAMPGQGVSSTFRFGVAFGMVIGVLDALQIPYQLVRPNIWKRAMKVGRDKDECRAQALRLHPELRSYFARKKDADRAEATLLADYGVRKHLPMSAPLVLDRAPTPFD